MVRSFRQMARFGLFTPKGRRIGRIGDALVHPDRNEVVGFTVERPRLLMLIDLRDRFISRDGFDITGEAAVVKRMPGIWDGAAARRIGISWDGTVIWYGMPVRTVSGERLGVVRDALFDEESGQIQAIGLSGGLTADAALGVRDIPGRLIVGFDGEAVAVEDEAAQVQLSGGAATAAGKGAAVVKSQAEEAAKVAGEAARTAARYGAAAAKAAAKSETGKKAVGWLKSFRDEVVDAMGDPDDDK